MDIFLLGRKFFKVKLWLHIRDLVLHCDHLTSTRHPRNERQPLLGHHALVKLLLQGHVPGVPRLLRGVGKEISVLIPLLSYQIAEDLFNLSNVCLLQIALEGLKLVDERSLAVILVKGRLRGLQQESPGGVLHHHLRYLMIVDLPMILVCKGLISSYFLCGCPLVLLKCLLVMNHEISQVFLHRREFVLRDRKCILDLRQLNLRFHRGILIINRLVAGVSEGNLALQESKVRIVHPALFLHMCCVFVGGASNYVLLCLILRAQSCVLQKHIACAKL